MPKAKWKVKGNSATKAQEDFRALLAEYLTKKDEEWDRAVDMEFSTLQEDGDPQELFLGIE